MLSHMRCSYQQLACWILGGDGGGGGGGGEGETQYCNTDAKVISNRLTE